MILWLGFDLSFRLRTGCGLYPRFDHGHRIHARRYPCGWLSRFLRYPGELFDLKDFGPAVRSVAKIPHPFWPRPKGSAPRAGRCRFSLVHAHNLGAVAAAVQVGPKFAIRRRCAFSCGNDFAVDHRQAQILAAGLLDEILCTKKVRLEPAERIDHGFSGPFWFQPSYDAPCLGRFQATFTIRGRGAHQRHSG